MNLFVSHKTKLPMGYCLTRLSKRSFTCFVFQTKPRWNSGTATCFDSMNFTSFARSNFLILVPMTFLGCAQLTGSPACILFSNPRARLVADRPWLCRTAGPVKGKRRWSRATSRSVRLGGIYSKSFRTRAVVTTKETAIYHLRWRKRLEARGRKQRGPNGNAFELTDNVWISIKQFSLIRIESDGCHLLVE